MKFSLAVFYLIYSLTAWGQELGGSALDDLIRPAEQGDANGQGVPRDYVQAHIWLTLAASRESGPNVKLFTKVRDSVAGRMSHQQIAEAQRLAHEWKPRTREELQKAGP